MGRKQKEYTKEFKLEAIRLAKDSGSVPRTARDLGIAAQSLYAWISQENESHEQAFPGRGKLKADDEELRKLRVEVKKLKEINEILKKATGYFAREMK